MSPGATTPPPIGEELLLLAAYLLSCGRGLLEEPPQYGPLRCLDATRRTLALAVRAGADHEGIAGLRTRLEEVMCGAMTERNLQELLDRLCEDLAVLLHESDLVTAGRPE
ncbi:DUF6092 family protein [Spirillospora sp. CA-255316]